MWNPNYENPNRWDPSKHNAKSLNPNRVGDHNPWGISEELPYKPIYTKEELCTNVFQKHGGHFRIETFEKDLKKALEEKFLIEVGPDQYQSGDGYMDHAATSYRLEKDRLRLDGYGLGQRQGQKQLPPSARDDDSGDERDKKRRKPKQIGYGDRDDDSDEGRDNKRRKLKQIGYGDRNW